MGTKKKSFGKKKFAKVSVVKLSNKRLNKLAKQGKLKKKVDKKQLQKLLKERTDPGSQPHLNDGIVEQKEEQDIPLEEADYQFFSTPGRDFSFLSDVNESENKGKRSRKRKKLAEEEVEESYEKIPRTQLGDDDKKTHLLPIKTKEKGIIPQVLEKEGEDDEEHDENSEGKENLNEEPTAPPPPPLSTAELLLLRHQKLLQKKERIAVLSSALIENPQEHYKKLKELRLLMEEEDPDTYITVTKLAAVSLLEVFKDIIPDYRIRELSDKEKIQKMKKDTKTLRDFEETLVRNYKKYLENLESSTKGSKETNGKGKSDMKRKRKTLDMPPEAQKSVRDIAVKCLCELLVSHPHFNFRTNIISVVIPFMDHRDEKLSNLVCGYVKRLFKEDKSGEVTLEVVRLIGRIIKAKHCGVQPKVMRTLLALKIKSVKKPDDDNDKKKMTREEKFMKTSRRERKREKFMGSLEKELQDAAVEQDRDKKLKIHTEIINMVFLTYFRILKTAQNSALLSPVLEGLAKFAHLINIDFFDDLFAVLRQLVINETLSYRESLHCVQAAFTILSGQGSSLNIDPLLFYTNLYKNLFHLNMCVGSDNVLTALNCLEIMITKRRKQVSQQRMLAFIKRLCLLSLQQDSHCALGILATVRSFMHAFPKSDMLLDTEGQGSGIYLPELDEPEHCNAHNTSLFELHLLKKHYHPAVQKYSHHVLASCPSQGHNQLPAEVARRNHSELMHDFDTTEMEFNPPMKKKSKAKPVKKHVRRYGEFYQKEIYDAVNGLMGDVTEADSSKSKKTGATCNGGSH